MGRCLRNGAPPRLGYPIRKTRRAVLGHRTASLPRLTAKAGSGFGTSQRAMILIIFLNPSYTATGAATSA